MKVYLIKESEITSLLNMIDRDPRYGNNGGSSQTFNEAERQAYIDAHRFYNYQVRGWVETIKKD